MNVSCRMQILCRFYNWWNKSLWEKYGDNIIVEMNRLAVSPKARTQDIKVAADMVLAVFRYLTFGNNDDQV